MKPDQQQALGDLLTSERILAAAVLADGEPYAGSLPYALTRNPLGFLVHVSGLARHTRGLGDGAPVSILVRRPDRPDGDPQQIERVTLQGVAHPLPRETPEYAEARKQYLERFPGAEITFGLGDFQMIRVEVHGGRYVAGFGRAINLNERNLAELEI